VIERVRNKAIDSVKEGKKNNDSGMQTKGSIFVKGVLWQKIISSFIII
jgi:hypothetical protein